MSAEEENAEVAVKEAGMTADEEEEIVKWIESYTASSSQLHAN